MVSSFKYLVFSTFIAAIYSKPVFRNLVLHEQRTDGIPQGFIRTGAAPPNKTITLRLALVNSNITYLEDKLYAVSNPDSALYGQHLSREEVDSFLAPPPASVSLINDFLSSHNINATTTTTSAGDWMLFSVPISKANEMFEADFTIFQHVETGKEQVRTLAYSIPSELKGHLELVHPTVSFDNPLGGIPAFSTPPTISESGNLTSRQDAPSSCDSTVTPTCLQDLYGIPTTKATQSTNVLAVSGFIQQFANSADLQTFLSNLRPDLRGTTFTLETLDGGQNPQGANQAGVEANLDIQYTVGVASGVPTTFISVGNDFQDDGLDGFLDIINFLNSMSNPPQVLTTSYNSNEDVMSSILADRLCNAYMAIGTRGTSIIFSSGDGGVSGIRSGQCSTFVPTFPSGCPFITSVGATSGISETAASFSSGGFSNIFGQPSYQTPAVSDYLNALGSTNDGLFNRTGRAFPDVSAQGENVEIVVGGRTVLVEGTSCSSPIFASVISLLNDRLIAAGRSPLGFLNPFLYSSAGAAALNDVTTGSNPGCDTDGFPAHAGWDPVTGLGTPNFEKLLSAVGL